MSDSKKSKLLPNEKDNLGPISETYSSISKELENLQNKLKCPDYFIYDF